MAYKFALYLLLAFFSFLMLQITLQYIPIDLDVAFLRIKQQYIHIVPWRIAFFVHVFTSLFTLLAGFTQFSTVFLRRFPNWHRWIGRLYVLDILLLTGPAGLVMGLFANGGISSRIAFVLLACLWMLFTFAAYHYARKRNIRQHKAFMWRSYALTLSAVTLRVWKYVIVALFAPPPMDVYQVVAWLGWVPNLLWVEWWLRAGKKRKA